jgi:uncharacterized protein (TIGR00725 family)
MFYCSGLMKRKPIIGVIGGGRCTSRVARMAEEVGQRIAEKGGILICGGLGGVMEAAAMGAKQAGGHTIGILPDDKTDSANPYIDFPIATGIGYARNVIIVKTADALIAIDGSYGTLSEVAYSLVFEKQIISLGSWEVDPKVVKAKDPQEAVDLAFRSLVAG